MPEERRRNHAFGVSPGTWLAVVMTAAGIVSTWAVMQDDISDLEKDIDRIESDRKDEHSVMWDRISGHRHGQ